MSGMRLADKVNNYNGAIHVIVRDAKTNEIIDSYFDKNTIKAFAKEILAHAIAPSKIWDPIQSNWVSHTVPLEDYRLRYMVLGASFDENGAPVTGIDTRYYTPDTINGGFKPKAIVPGANNGGGLINPIPISEPFRPLKRIEKIYFEPSYQPAGSPLVYDDVRALNNVIVFQTTLKSNEYNGLSNTSGDFLTLTEVALVGAPEIGSVGDCECDPHSIFLSGDNSGVALDGTAAGTKTISLDNSVTNVNLIKEGDQVKIVAQNSAKSGVDYLNQANPYYLVTQKADGGRDLILDRVVVDSDNTPITGPVGVFKDSFKMFSQKILSSPIKKSSDFVIDIRWLITMG